MVDRLAEVEDLKSGMLSLQPLYEFLELEHDQAGLHGRSQEGRRYGAVVTRICRTIAATQGFYLWGRYERNGLWRNVYLGKAGFGRTAHLRARIQEELKDERACIWCAFVSVRTMEAVGERNYPRKWHQYKKDMHRALKKKGTTHIVWVADPHLDNSQVQNIESDLIETLSPSANMSRPVPPVILQEHTKTIIGELRALIHAHRPEHFFIRERGLV